MEQTRQYPSRPARTEDFIRRLAGSECNSEERKALEALAESMIKIFRDDPRLSYIPEAAELSSAVTGEDYQSLVLAFANAIINGTSDGGILDRKLLVSYAYVLQHAKGILSAATVELGSVLVSLQKRLEGAIKQAGNGTQYQLQLVCTLSAVLDAMVDLKIYGLDRVDLHEPLQEQLKGLIDHQELRLSQAAAYACEALVGLPNNESPYHAFLRHASTVAEGAAKVAGAVPTTNPARLIDAIPDFMNVPDLIKSVIDVAADVGITAKGTKPLPKQKDWYIALRYTDMLIQAGAFQKLEEFIQKVPCHQGEKFLCGVYSQFEQAWEAGDSSTKARIIEILQRTINQRQTKDPVIQGWRNLVADTLDRPDWKENLPRTRHLRPWKNKKVECNLKALPVRRTKPGNLPADLLEAAWSVCEQAQRFYADIRIREYYTQQQRLEIERLSGQLLPMSQCYINLCVVEHSSRGNTEQPSEESEEKSRHRSSPFSLFSRLKVDDSNKNKEISLPALFDPRKMRDGAMVSPRRVLIRGSAGVGKTTLCKKIVYDYLHHQLWAGLFDRLLWVPLRRLKEKMEYRLEKLLCDIFFTRHGEDSCSVQISSKIIGDRTHSRTLFILDGLDEVSRNWNPGTDMADFLVDLLNQPNVIITSRPYGRSLPGVERFDLELETVGFYSEQVDAYLKKTFQKPEDEKQAREIQCFIQDHWLIQGLVRIPIQLDALCYSWDIDFRSGGVPKTMTALYEAIELKLWKKDICRLGKRDDGNPLTEGSVRAFRAAKIESIAQSEISILESLAFTGLHNDVIEFTSNHRDYIYKHFEPKEINILSGTTLANLSLLRTSDASLEDDMRSYHFLHLTLQEFFAARYFVRQWTGRQKLCCLVFGSGEPEYLTPETLLLQEKYNVRFDIVWRFVAGLLQKHQELLQRFFQLLKDEPCDLLGPVHQRLLMHCFSEVSSSGHMSGLGQLPAEMETQLSRWLLFECNFCQKTQLGREMECPEHLLNNLLREESREVKKNILEALSVRSSVSSDILHLVASWLRNVASKDLTRYVSKTLISHLKSLSKGILEALASLLEDRDLDAKSRAVDALIGQYALPEEILKALVSLLKHGDRIACFGAANVLRGQSALPDEILKALVSLLKDGDRDAGYRAASVLEGRPALSEEILRALASLLNDGDMDAKSKAAGVLGGQPALPEEILRALISLLKDGDRYVRSRAADALGGQSALPEEMLKALVSLLKDRDSRMMIGAAHALGHQYALPEETLKALVSLLKDKDWEVRTEAAHALGGKSALPKEILKALASLLEDGDSDTRCYAIYALERQSVLPEEILKALALQLGSGDSNVRYFAAFTLCKQSALPEENPKALVSLLKDREMGVKYVICGALSRLTLSEETLEALVPLFKDGDSDVRSYAVRALYRQSTLSEEILKALVPLLKDEESVRTSAADALGGQSALPEEILKALVPLLKDEDLSVRINAAGALGGQYALPEEILEILVSSLQHESKDVYLKAEEVLRNHKWSFPIYLRRDPRCLKFLYRIWLRRSFSEQVSCYVRGESLYVDLPEGAEEIPFESDDQKAKFMLAIQEAQAALGVPSLGASNAG
ncbi:hypothetical protein GP486_001052 [Trichoglossum hirsutum]|uniref:NACHT domain-containing protein n=1 Tax=Trichoglossum hirsutum TaxID=265104 RepID=A0A9P8LHL0_9PEZI|nr:hypothetical protein GP486_001052 [Trichoglossum hirsutum]